MSTLLGLGGLYIVVSATMVAFNKYLIHEGRFPFAVPLVLLHAGFSSVCALVLFVVKPELFPSLTSRTERVPIDRDLILRGALPIALLFSVQLVLSNTAYLHSSMAFLQMMKESNLVLVYFFALAAAMEVFCWTKVKIILMIVLATTLTIHSELHFSWTGFVLQGTSQLFESSKIVLQVVLLSSAGRKLDVLTYVLIVMPVCFCVLGSILLTLVYVYPTEHLKTPRMSDIYEWWPLLALNACIAFALNLTIALFMKHSSPVGFILAGIVKDAFIVLASVCALHDPISMLQMVGFVSQLFLIWVWSIMKIYPDKFQGGILAGLASMTEPSSESKSLLIAEPLDEIPLRACYGTKQEQERNHSTKQSLQDAFLLASYGTKWKQEENGDNC